MVDTSRLEQFKKANQAMVAKNDTLFNSFGSLTYNKRLGPYSLEEVDKIIESGSSDAQIELSRTFFARDGFYRRLLIYYANLLKYSYVLIPNLSAKSSLSNEGIQKKYRKALQFVENLNLSTLLSNYSLQVLRDGAYYGIISDVGKDGVAKIDLAPRFCRSRLKDIYGNDIIEFNVGYFDTLQDETLKKDALSLYPQEVRAHYKKWKNRKVTNAWVVIPPNSGICFNLFGSTSPCFLNVIPATIQYDDAVDTEQERALNEISKIIVQKVPHLNDGQLLFEPDEAESMHAGAVDMLKNNRHTSVLTTYTDVEAITSKSSADSTNGTLDRMVSNIYYQAGASSQIFCATNTTSIESSIKNDTSLMMLLANKYAQFITQLINRQFATSAISFKLTILPITYYNESDYLTDAFKIAQSGYSFLLPSIAMGITQADLSGLKDLENDYLKLGEKLKPLMSAYTQSGQTGDEGGRPTKKDDQKAERTIEDIEGANDQGGTN